MKPRGMFPTPSWAWPPQRTQQLLRAAALRDSGAARMALIDWLAANDLDDITFADHRLMGAVAERHGQGIAQLPEYPRLIGLQRQLWTQSQLGVAATLPALQMLHDAGIPIMLLKGAARVALDPAVQRQRAQQDIDVLVPPDFLGRAAALLVRAGWHSGYGDSELRAQARAMQVRAVNFINPPWGNIDLHRTAYHGRQVHEHLDKQIWNDALAVEFFGVPVLIPSAAERLAISIAHGVTEPDSHSDWLLDAHSILNSQDLDWKQAHSTFVARHMVSQAEIALSYLRDGLGTSLSASGDRVLEQLAADREMGRLWVLILARSPDPARATQAELLLRKIASLVRLRRIHLETYFKAKYARWQNINQPHLGVVPARRSKLTIGVHDYRLSVSWPIPAGGATVFTADIGFQTASGPRRIDFELNSNSRHLAHFHVPIITSWKGEFHVRLSARIAVPGGDTELRLEARPKMYLHANSPDETITKFGAVPFRVIRSSLGTP